MCETTTAFVPAAMQQVSINLTQSLHEVYEPDWHGKDDVMVIGKVRVITSPALLDRCLVVSVTQSCPGVPVTQLN